MIPESDTSTALHGIASSFATKVRPRGLRPDRGLEQETGSVIRILERKRSQIVGTLQRGRQFLYVIPDDPRIAHDIYVLELATWAASPTSVTRSWSSCSNGLRVTTILKAKSSRCFGAPDEEGVDMLSVLRQYNLPLHSPNPFSPKPAPSVQRLVARAGRARRLSLPSGHHD